MSTVVANAIGHADLVVVPCGATSNDLETVPDTQEVIEGKPYLFILQRVEQRKATSQAAAVLSKAGRVAEEMIGNRASYADAPAKGLAGNELDKEAKAEVAAIWGEIESILYAPPKAEKRSRIRGGAQMKTNLQTDGAEDDLFAGLEAQFANRQAQNQPSANGRVSRRKAAEKRHDARRAQGAPPSAVRRATHDPHP